MSIKSLHLTFVTKKQHMKGNLGLLGKFLRKKKISFDEKCEVTQVCCGASTMLDFITSSIMLFFNLGKSV